jgi:hypothetical protein
MIERPTCKDCLYWKNLGGKPPNEWMGECRRHSPVFDNEKPRWPPTDDDHWCGDYTPIFQQ